MWEAKIQMQGELKGRAGPGASGSCFLSCEQALGTVPWGIVLLAEEPWEVSEEEPTPSEGWFFSQKSALMAV